MSSLWKSEQESITGQATESRTNINQCTDDTGIVEFENVCYIHEDKLLTAHYAERDEEGLKYSGTIGKISRHQGVSVCISSKKNLIEEMSKEMILIG